MTKQPLRSVGYITLPTHAAAGGFDHAAVHAASGHVYVAHTANNAVDVFDPSTRKALFSIPGLAGVAGVIVSDEAQLIITSNRSENTIGIFPPGAGPDLRKVAVGKRPNGLAYAHRHRLVLVANVGEAALPSSHTLSVVNLDKAVVQSEIAVPGRSRWAIYDPDAQVFFVNIADPAQIVAVDAQRPTAVARTFPIPAAGPHGLDLDLATHRLFCACDEGTLITLEATSGKVVSRQQLSGAPDVIFFNREHQHLYVAVGDPGVIDVFDTASMQIIGSVATEKGAHTLALAPAGDCVYAFLPGSHRAAVYQVQAV